MKHDFSELRLDGVTRRFAGHGGAAFNALSALTMTIKRGEFIALLGPSGCGKSTALNCIAGLLPLSDGSIMLDDVRIDTLPPERRGFGMVFQNYALFPHMTVDRNVGFGLRMRGVAAAEVATRVAKALKMVQLTGQEHKLPGQLSGGQQQRVAIARAIVIEPPLVLMDEPLSNLDAKLRIETRAEIRRIHTELGRATIYVTHDQDEALSLADRIVVMKDGVAQQIAPPEEVYLQPSNLHVARFMGYRNVLELDVAGQDGDRVTLTGPGIRLLGTKKLPLANGRAAVLHGARSLHHQPAERCDRHIARAEPLHRAVADRPHAFPHRDVLVGNASDAGEIAGRHRGAILLIKVVGGTHVVEEAVDILPPLEHVELAPRLRIDALLVGAGKCEDVLIGAGAGRPPARRPGR